MKAKTKRRWTLEEKQYLESIHKGKGYRELAELMTEKFEQEYSLNQIKYALRRYKLNTGLTGYFEKGSIPWNKGKTGFKDSGGSFIKGHIPKKTTPIGTERVDTRGYTHIKVGFPNTWKPKHRYIYEKHFGEIPKGYNIMFLDKNKANFDIDNLILVSNAQIKLLNHNNLIFEDKELTKAGVNIVKILDKINNINKTK